MEKSLGIVLILLAGCGVLAGVRLWPGRRRNADRIDNEALEAFIKGLPGFDPTKVETTYRVLQRLAGSEGPIRPEDRLLEDLDIDQGALDSFFEEQGIEQAINGPRRIRTCAGLATNRQVRRMIHVVRSLDVWAHVPYTVWYR